MLSNLTTSISTRTVSSSRAISWLKAAKRHFTNRDALRVVYGVQVGEDLYVLHAFQKKWKQGIGTPKAGIGVIEEQLQRLKEALRR